MLTFPSLPRVITSADGAEGMQIVSVEHDTRNLSANFVVRLTPEKSTCKLCVYTLPGFDAARHVETFRVPPVDSPFLALATWFVWTHFEQSVTAGDTWRPGTMESLPMDSHIVVQWLRIPKPQPARPDRMVSDVVRLSTPFGVPAVVDPLLAFMVGHSYEQLRRAVMDLRGHSWDVVEDRERHRLELEARGAFRAAHGLLTAYEVRTLLSAPRYRGVLDYWDKAISLRGNVPADPSGAIANAAHAVEALARLLVKDEANTAGNALSVLAARGQLPREVADLAKLIHGRTSGAVGARHGTPQGPTDSLHTADFYLDLLAATLRQLLAIDT